MYVDNRHSRPKPRLFLTGILLCGIMGTAGGQNLLAVMDLAGDSTVSHKDISAVCDKISAVLAEDTAYMQFDRALIPELLNQYSLDASAATCSEVQCLSLIGSLIGANIMVGGTITGNKKVTTISLNLVDVAGKKAINTVNMSSRSEKDVLIATEIPALVRTLMSPDTKKQPGTTSLAHKKSFFTNPFLYIGTFIVGGGAAGAYYYKYHYKNRALSGTPGGGPVVDPTENPELSIEDAPERTR